jgi:3-oxoacyl-[acyl-carrier protein] reductase
VELSRVRALVTGAARGLGREFALQLARAGAQVAAGDQDEAGLRTLEEEARGLPGRVLGARVDVSQEAAVRDFVAGAFEAVPAINTVVNNAGVLLDGVLVSGEPGWVRRLPLAQWRKAVDTNLTGSFLVAREAAAAMIEAGVDGGLIVNVSSLARAGNAGQSAYAASKAGVDAATRSWAAELAPRIRVAGIAPGVVDTPMIGHVSPEAQEELRARTLAGRFGTPHEIWLALRFVIECEFFSGRMLEVDGGARF